ncbi:MAG: MOSC N-terminal beta barrel domain-containing protein [Actinomycetota bacterium]|jgi:hypothetical protein
MHIESIWQYPVKSMIGTVVADAALAPHGMVNDRTWAIRDEERGGIRGAKKIGDLMQFAATHTADGHVLITLPDGATVHSADADVHARLSAALQHEVTLWPLQAPTDLEHYRRGAPDSTDPMTELRAVFGRDEDEPLPDFSIFPPVIFEYESPPGTYLDAFPLMLMTTSALRSLAAALPDSAVDVRRFRPSLVVDTGDADGHPEFSWVGKQVRIGEVVLDIPSACPRCVMVTRAVTTAIPADRAVLRHIVRDLDQNVGVYATVVQPGVVRAGDTVEVI